MSDESKKIELLYNLLAEESLAMPDKQFQQELEEVDQTTLKAEADKLKNIFANSLSEFQLRNEKKQRLNERNI